MSGVRTMTGVAGLALMAVAVTGCDSSNGSTQANASPTSPTAVATTTPAPAPAPPPAPAPAPTGPLGPPDAVFVQAGDTWRYLDDGSDQGTAWRASTFDDSAWSSGGSELGYGDNDEITVVSFGADPNAKPITTYFRKTFTVNDASAHTVVTLDMIIDDGAVVYVNGAEVFRTNMPGGAVTSTTRASSAIQNSDIVVSGDINPGVLTTGANVIAVEVHQVAPDSPDLSFNLALRDGTRSSQPQF